MNLGWFVTITRLTSLAATIAGTLVYRRYDGGSMSVTTGETRAAFHYTELMTQSMPLFTSRLPYGLGGRAL